MTKIGMAQMLVEPGRPVTNLRRAADYIEQAAGAQCAIVVLPECVDLGWTHASARELAEPIPGPTTDALADAARTSNIMVAAGVTERAAHRIFNAAVLIDATGSLLLRHRKINEVPFARQMYAQGRCLAVAETEHGGIGLSICADNLSESLCLGHALGRMGTSLLLSPSAWAVPPTYDNLTNPYGDQWHRPYAELATTYEMTVVGVSNVGPVMGGEWDGWSCIGASMAVAPTGSVIARGAYGLDAAALLTIEA